jgi:hypothetical protein
MAPVSRATGTPESHGLKTNPGAKTAILPAQDTQEYAAPNALGQKHESLEGWWWIPELLPRRIKDPANNWTPTWIWPLGRPRTVLASAALLTHADDAVWAMHNRNSPLNRCLACQLSG